MELVRDRSRMQRLSQELRHEGLRLALVPTMGALHRGHLSLLEVARPGCDRVAVSIFVNPLQFGPQEDLERYPRDLESDLRKLEVAGCDLVFSPSESDFLAADACTTVEVAELGQRLCGATRTGHFRGVTTIVAKLFHVVQPDVAVFGQKDAQQAIILRRMVSDLDFPIEMRFGSIVRDPDGLALSSRNAYLSDHERAEALLLHESLRAARRILEDGERRAAVVRDAVRAVLQRGTTLRIEYIELVETTRLQALEDLDGLVLLAIAAHVGSTRLIDNLLLEIEGSTVRDGRLDS